MPLPDCWASALCAGSPLFRQACLLLSGFVSLWRSGCTAEQVSPSSLSSYVQFLFFQAAGLAAACTASAFHLLSSRWGYCTGHSRLLGPGLISEKKNPFNVVPLPRVFSAFCELLSLNGRLCCTVCMKYMQDGDKSFHTLPQRSFHLCFSWVSCA